MSLLSKAKQLKAGHSTSQYHRDWLTILDDIDPKFAKEVRELVEAWHTGQLNDSDGDPIFSSKAQLCVHIQSNTPAHVPEVSVNWLSQRVIPSIIKELRHG